MNSATYIPSFMVNTGFQNLYSGSSQMSGNSPTQDSIPYAPPTITETNSVKRIAKDKAFEFGLKEGDYTFAISRNFKGDLIALLKPSAASIGLSINKEDLLKKVSSLEQSVNETIKKDQSENKVTRLAVPAIFSAQILDILEWEENKDGQKIIKKNITFQKSPDRQSEQKPTTFVKRKGFPIFPE